MRIGVLGTGMVGEAIASKLVAGGHEVTMGARAATNGRAAAWASRHGTKGRSGTFADAAAWGELVFNCTAGIHSLAALAAAGSDNLHGKIIVDVANPLDYSKGRVPQLTVLNDDSLGEQIQRAYPASKVVKTLNTMSASVMVDPGRVSGTHTVFVSGDDEDAKRVVYGLLAGFGWTKHSVIDLGGIETARGVEMSLPLWLYTWKVIGSTDFNIAISC